MPTVKILRSKKYFHTEQVESKSKKCNLSYTFHRIKISTSSPLFRVSDEHVLINITALTPTFTVFNDGVKKLSVYIYPEQIYHYERSYP